MNDFIPASDTFSTNNKQKIFICSITISIFVTILGVYVQIWKHQDEKNDYSESNIKGIESKGFVMEEKREDKI